MPHQSMDPRNEFFFWQGVNHPDGWDAEASARLSAFPCTADYPRRCQGYRYQPCANCFRRNLALDPGNFTTKQLRTIGEYYDALRAREA